VPVTSRSVPAWPRDERDVLRFVAACATSAPSGGNVQPWRFEASGRVLRAYADPSRSSLLDFEGRATLLALGAAHDRGLPTLVDLDTGPEDVLLKLFHNADMAIASADGARLLTGECDPVAAVKAMGRQHPGLVAVTTGEDGAFWRAPMGDRINHVRPRRVETVDTLAAGDVFHGAFALRIAEGAEYFEAFEFAAAAAAIKCTRFGGRLGAPTRAEVEALLG
jgi:sulfofructose kinase